MFLHDDFNRVASCMLASGSDDGTFTVCDRRLLKVMMNSIVLLLIWMTVLELIFNITYLFFSSIMLGLKVYIISLI